MLRKMNRGVSAVLCFVVVALVASIAASQEMRTWTAKGGFTVEAKFVSLEDGKKVILERPNGSKVKVDIDKLSDEDQQYIQGAAESPFEPIDEDAAQDNSGSGPGIKKVDVDWATVRLVSLAPLNGAWSLTLGAIPSPAVPKPPAAIPLPPNSEDTRGLVVSDSAGVAAIGSLLMRGQDNTTRLVVCSFADRGKIVAQGVHPVGMIPICISEDGKSIVMRSEEEGKRDRLELWQVEDSQIHRAMQWTPYSNFEGGERDVQWAQFVGPTGLLTLGNSGKLALWNVTTMQPEYTVTIQRGIAPAISPDRKYAVFLNNEDMAVLDIAAGDVLAVVPATRTHGQVLRFSPSGKQLAIVGGDKMFLYETTTGKLNREIELVGVPYAPEIIWTSERHILLGGRILFDTDTRVPLWEYTGHQIAAADNGVCSFIVSEGNSRPGALINAVLPQAGVELALETAMKDPNFFVLKPGTTVRLNVDGLPDPKEREKARQALTKKLQDLGMKVGNDGTIDLVAATEVGKPEEHRYTTFGFGFRFGRDETKVTARAHYVHLRFMYQNKAAWQSGSGGIPSFITLDENESIEQHIKKYERFHYGFFSDVRLPKLLIKPTGGATLGSSRVSVSGIR